MEASKCPDAGGAISSLVVSNSEAVSRRDTETLNKTLMSGLHQTSNQSKMCDKIISITPARKSSVIQSKRLSSDSATPLPCTGGFRLQPRKNIPNLNGHSPTTSSSASCRGRKRGAQNLVSSLGSPFVGFRKTAFTASASIGINTRDFKGSHGLEILSERNNQSRTANSPIIVHHAMQSMSIRSPAPSTPSLQENGMRFREVASPFIVFSPSLKACPYRQRPRSESFCSFDSSTRHPGSIGTGPRIAPMYVSPRRKVNCNKNLSNNGESVSTPRSHCHAANTSQAPATPTSIRTLPSPHATPLPRSMRLTPRSRRGRDELSSEASILLSPIENLDHASVGKEGTSIFSFEGGTEFLEEAKQKAMTRSSSYVPSPFSCSRTSVASKTAHPASPFVGESRGGNFRVETRSLLGAQDSTATLDDIISANARSSALDCDGSLSVDSDVPFVLTNPTTLAKERDTMTMPPPRPSRRRKVSLAPVFVSIDASTHINENKITIQNEIDVGNNNSRNMNLSSGIVSHSQINILSLRYGEDKKLDSSNNFTESSPKSKSTNTRNDHNYFGRLKHIESSCSLVGLGLAESSSSTIDYNAEPGTPPTKLDTFISSTPPRTPSMTSVRISRSDADNVHLTIASMAVHYQQPSPTLMACNS